MSLLQRYFWRQGLWPLLITLSALTALALLTQSLSTLDLIVDNRQSALTFLYITVLALPQLLGIILPLALFMAILYTLNRLNVDSETTVAKSVGMSPWQISDPFVRLACYAMIANLLLNLFLQPLAFRNMREQLVTVKTDLAAQMVRPGEFITPVPGLTVYAREILPNGNMEDVMIRDARSETPRTYTAKSGRLARSEGEVRLTLQNGLIQQLERDDTLIPISFEAYQIDLSSVMALDTVLRLKTSDRFLHELFYPSPSEYHNKSFRNALYAEGHTRLSSPIYNITLTLLALCFLIRGELQRMGYRRRIAICAALGFFIRLSGFAIVSACEKDPGLNFLQYTIPVMTSVFCLFFLLTLHKGGQFWSDFHLVRRGNPELTLSQTAS